jgi:hypothetical protein
MTGLLTQDELNPLQEARRCAEEHLETIRAIAIARLKAGVRGEEENNRYHRIADVVGALQTIYDSVSELEFEEEQPAEPAPPEEPEDDEDVPEDEDEDEDEDEEDE